MKLKCLCAAAACCVGLAQTARAQQSADPAPSREPVAKPQRPPLSDLEPVVPGLAGSDEQQGGIKGFLSRINSDAEGLTPRAGSIVPGGGLALGAHYRRAVVNGQLFLDAEHLVSIKEYHSTAFGLTTRPLFDGRVTIGATVKRDSLPQEDFYGLGPDSSEASHTSYSRVGLETAGWMAIRPGRGLELRSTLGVIHTTLGAGQQSGIPSIEQRFAATTADGMNRETDYLHAGLTLSLDRRDSVKYTRRGGYYQASVQRYVGLGSSNSGFFRVDLDARRYVPVRGFTDQDSLAIRGRLAMTNASRDVGVPFYFLPRLGGSNLRAYDTSRFVDRHAAVVNVEYRWQLRRRLQIVGFADAGQVSPTFGDFALSRFQTSVGAGVRYRGFRVEYAHGAEGGRLHLGVGMGF